MNAQIGLTRPGDTILLCTAGGRAMHFDEKAARKMGRTARGVRGIRLKDDDRVVAMAVGEKGAFLLTASEKGYGKRTVIEDYPIKGRGGQGVISIRCTSRNGRVIGAVLCKEGDDAMFISRTGMIVRTPVSAISTMGRNTQGVRLVNLKDEDALVAVDAISESDLERYDRGGERDEADAEPGDAPDAPVDGAPDEADADAADDETEEE